MSSPRPLRSSNASASSPALVPIRPNGPHALSLLGPRLQVVDPREAGRERPSKDERGPGASEGGGGTELLPRSKVAPLLGVSRSTVTRWAREGRLDSLLTLGGHYRFDREHIEKLRRSLYRPGDRTE